MMEIGPFDYHPGDHQRFRDGHLWKIWASNYPQLFDELDVAVVESQASGGHHFHEWLAAVLLYERTGYLSLVAKYEFPKHRRKQDIIRNVLSVQCLEVVMRRGTQAPDLFVYRSDLSDWYLCEVKGPKDRLSEKQRRYYEELANVTDKPIRLLTLRAVRTAAPWDISGTT